MKRIAPAETPNMDLAGLMDRLLQIERAIGRVEAVELRRMVVAVQLSLLEMQRNEIDEATEERSLTSRPALVYEMQETRVERVERRTVVISIAA